MDCFAVSLAQGIATAQSPRWKDALLMALLFGLFQAGMPFISFTIGGLFVEWLTKYSRWIAFVLLWLIGINMLWEGAKKDDCTSGKQRFSLPRLIALAVATSIDALSVGVLFVPTPDRIVYALVMIGLTSLLLAIAGYAIGTLWRRPLRIPPDWIGGIVLMGLGVKMLLN